MAKYSRFDPRNKKRGKHKSQSLDKDFRIKNPTVKKSKTKIDDYEKGELCLTQIKLS